jgi:hypothetical protein
MRFPIPDPSPAGAIAPPVLRTVSAWLVAGLIAAPSRAQEERFPVSPTGIPYTVPAAARAAGWTLAAPEARTGLVGSNPVFLAGGATRELAVDAAWQHRDIDESLSLDRFESRIASITGKYSTGTLAVGFSYQRPFRAEMESVAGPSERDLQVVLGAVAADVLPLLRVGASLAGQFVESVDNVTTYQATLGAETSVGPLAVAGAVKSGPFGGGADEVLEPGWLQLDARAGLGPVLSVGARLGVGWWNDSLDGALETPVDVGAGATWGLFPMLRVLGGVHHIRERLASCSPQTAGSCLEDLTDLDQGTFLDLGVMLALPVVNIGLAVEDSHVFAADSPSTWVTLSANAGF